MLQIDPVTRDIANTRPPVSAGVHHFTRLFSSNDKLRIFHRLGDKQTMAVAIEMSKRRQKDYAQHSSLVHCNLRHVHTLFTTLTTPFS
jgi:hypothetical protein